ncbi:MAG TPA: YdeI/OmpD-associated family protein [Longimicrobium sp.]|nr:YdeI/OmpD-associated family protein [Longimicrobium sp.]
MGARDPRFDAYIGKAADFAKPILTYLREVVHEACPDVEEKIKWSSPHFDYRGPLCHMAAFKQHCAFGFWKGALVLEQAGGRADEAMGHFGRITSIDDLPPREVLIGYIHQAMRLNQEGVKAPARKQPDQPRPELEVPDDLTAALEANEAALTTFNRFSPSHRREYLEWITEAKTDATRQKRLRQAVEWMAEGKSRHWKYARS